MSAEALMSLASSAEKRLITIASGKGGVGKTFVAVSLAHALARMGKNILLFDGDFGLANINIQLGLNPARDLADVIAGRAAVADIIHRYEDATIQNAAFDIIAGNSGSGTLANLGPVVLGHLRGCLVQLATHYDHVIVDLGAGVDHNVMTLADHRGRCIVVMTPDPAALTDAYALIKLRHQRQAISAVDIIVNAAASRAEAQFSYEGLAHVCAQFLKVTPNYLGYIRQDSAVSDAVREQVPLLTRHSASPAAQDVTRIAEAIAAA